MTQPTYRNTDNTN